MNMPRCSTSCASRQQQAASHRSASQTHSSWHKKRMKLEENRTTKPCHNRVSQHSCPKLAGLAPAHGGRTALPITPLHPAIQTAAVYSWQQQQPDSATQLQTPTPVDAGAEAHHPTCIVPISQYSITRWVFQLRPQLSPRHRRTAARPETAPPGQDLLSQHTATTQHAEQQSRTQHVAATAHHSTTSTPQAARLQEQQLLQQDAC